MDFVIAWCCVISAINSMIIVFVAMVTLGDAKEILKLLKESK